MAPWTWAVLILFVGMALAMLEVFIPSGGILGFLSFTAVVASVVLAFRESPATGFVFLGLAIVGVPAVLATAFHILPQTPMGKKIILGAPTEKEVSRDDERNRLKALLGKRGVTLSMMLPSGRVRIDGRLYDALSEGLPIDAGQTVTVIDTSGGSLVVRVASEAPPARSSDDPLARPIENFGFDPFNDPGNAASG